MRKVNKQKAAIRRAVLAERKACIDAVVTDSRAPFGASKACVLIAEDAKSRDAKARKR